MVNKIPVSAGDTRDMDLIPGSGRSRGGGHGNPLQYSCLKNPTDRGFPSSSVGKESLIVQEMQVRCLGREDPVEEGMATHSSILAWIIQWTVKPNRLRSSWGHKEPARTEVTEHARAHTHMHKHTYTQRY